MNDFQYNSCISRGICSVSPRMSALILVLVIYLKITAKYSAKLFKRNELPDNVKSLILNSSALIVQNQELTEQSFLSLISMFKENLPMIIEKYKLVFGEDCFNYEDITSGDIFGMCDNITDAIKLGERIFKNTVSSIPQDVRNYHQILLVIAKSLSINLLDYESYDSEYNEVFEQILEIYNSINPENEDIKFLKDIIEKSVNTDNKLMLKIRDVQEKIYGKQFLKEVSYSTEPSKAVLIAGSNIKELELLLEALKETDIDVYTHDDMMLAHTFPKFSTYKNLKGQYGQGGENCLIDFVTFPGAILFSKHSLHNTENLYRGRLFTTDEIVPKGVIQVKNGDYSKVIESANAAKGFKSGKSCETVTIGYDFDDVREKIKISINNNNYNKIVLIGSENYSLEQKSYFEKLIKFLPKTTLIISFSYNFEKENLIHLNTCFDSVSILKFYNEVQTYKLPITIFMPKCERSTVSQLLYFSTQENTNVFVGKCTPIILNPSLINTLEKDFNIKSITTALEDVKD